MKNLDRDFNSMWIFLPFLMSALLMTVLSLTGVIKPLPAIGIVVASFLIANGLIAFLKIRSIDRKVNVMTILAIILFSSMLILGYLQLNVSAIVSFFLFLGTLIWRAMLAADQESEMWRKYHEQSLD